MITFEKYNGTCNQTPAKSMEQSDTGIYGCLYRVIKRLTQAKLHSSLRHALQADKNEWFSDGNSLAHTVLHLQQYGESYKEMDLRTISKISSDNTKQHMDEESKASKIVPLVLKYCPHLRSLTMYSNDIPYATHCEIRKRLPCVIGRASTTTYSV